MSSSSNGSIEMLRALLAGQPLGPIEHPTSIAGLLADCWHHLDGFNATRMKPEKLYRMESPAWYPPHLEFLIERHGGTVLGSSRATVYRWRVNVAECSAEIVGETHRQLHAMSKRLNVKPLRKKSRKQ